MKKISSRGLLWLMVALAFGLRVWQVNSLPSLLNRDEAALAYNALLLEQTGRDEWNRVWPLNLESFGDYKLVGYSTILAPLFTLLGPADWVVRLPSVVAGSALVWLVFAFTRQLKWTEDRSLWAALLIALAPVFVFYSRMAFEANVALSALLGALILIVSLVQRPTAWKCLGLAALLTAAVLTYNTPLLLLPSIMVWTALIFPKKQRSAVWLVELILGLVFVGGVLVLLPTAAQKSGITIFTDETVWSQWSAFRSSLPGAWQTIAGNKYLYLVGLMVRNFLASFSPRFLVTHGGSHPWHSLPTTGHLTAGAYIFGLLGIAVSAWQVWRARHHFEVRQKAALLFLLCASLAPSVVTVDSPHATRSLLFFVVFLLFSVSGIFWLVQRFSKRRAKWAWIALLSLVLAEAGLHAYQLFGLYPRQQAVFQPGFAAIIQQVEREHPTTPVAVVDPLGYQYILTAWYLKIPASQYFATVVRQLPDPIGFRYGQQVTHYHFIAQPSDRAPSETILVQWSSGASAWMIEENL